MDRTDKKILTLLQEDANISNQALADAVSLSPTPCLRRVNHLKEKNIILRTVALLNEEAIGLQLTVILSVGLEKHAQQKMKHFENVVKKIPEVVQCYLIAGQTADYLLKVVVSDMKHYQKFLMEKITQIEGVTNVHSSFVMQKIIDKTVLPLDYA